MYTIKIESLCFFFISLFKLKKNWRELVFFFFFFLTESTILKIQFALDNFLSVFKFFFFGGGIFSFC